MKLLGVLLLLPLMLTGCTTFNVTNLTPSSLPRNDDGFYPVEMEIHSNQQSMRRDSIQPFVMVGFDFYAMDPTPLLSNRWEALVPVPAEQNFIHYQFKIDYDVNEFGGRGQRSQMTTEYKLTIRD